MLRQLLVLALIVGASATARAQAPGIDPRGLAAHSAPVIIGVIEEPSQVVIRPDKVPKTAPMKQQPNGTYIAELPQRPLDHLVGYLFRVRVQEILKPDRRVRANETITVFAPFKLEGGVSLPTRQRFLLALAVLNPKKEDFEKTTVVKAGQISSTGAPFEFRARYYLVAGDANGAVPITDKNRKLIQEIKEAIRLH